MTRRRCSGHTLLYRSDTTTDTPSSISAAGRGHDSTVAAIDARRRTLVGGVKAALKTLVRYLVVDLER